MISSGSSVASSGSLLTKIQKGDALVIGAPGSGKTGFILDLVAEYESLGYSPEEILVITPQRAQAAMLRDQLALASSQVSTGPRARSITSYAFEILTAENPEIKLLSGAKQQSLIASLITAAEEKSLTKSWGVDSLTYSLSGFHSELRDLFSVLVENNIDASGLTALQRQWPSANWAAALDLYPAYLDELERARQVDASQLIVRAAALTDVLKPPRVLLLDDAQDISLAGLELVSRISSQAQLIVVGDPDSVTMGFRASAGAFVEFFVKNRPELVQVYLEDQLPQPRSVVNLMSKIVQRIPTSLALAHRPLPIEPVEQAEFALFDNQISESDYIASELRISRVQADLPWSQMCVVARTRVQLDQLASDLSARSIPVRILGVQRPLSQQPAARAVLEFGQLAFGESDHDLVLQLLGSRLIGLSVIQQRRLFRQLAQLEQFEALSRAQVLQSLFDDPIDLDTPEIRSLNKAIELLQELRANRGLGSYAFVSAVWSLAPSSKLQELAAGSSEVALAANRDIDAILELFAAATRFDQQQLGTPAEFVQEQLAAQVVQDSLAGIAARDAVVLATPSQLAGSQFQVVAIPRLQEGIWPNLKPRNSMLGAASLQSFLAGRSESPTGPTRAELADELRLFYKSLGVTRSKLVLSAMEASDEQPSQFLQILRANGKQTEVNIEFDPRRLVGKLRSELLQGDSQAAPLLAALALIGASGAHPSNWQGLLEPSTSEDVVQDDESLRLSASKLEAFEKCPLHWFINSFGGDGSSFEASIGTLLHAAMEVSLNHAQLSEFVESNWHTLKFDAEWLNRSAHRRAVKMLGLISEYLDRPAELVASEQGFEISLGKLVVAGKIDRVERAETGLIAADLKTGKTPSAKDVQEHRQLALYQLGLREIFGEEVAGGRIISVGGGSLKVMEQPKLEGESEAVIRKLLERAEAEIGQAQFVAEVSGHCEGDAKCQLLLARAVTNA